MSDKASHLYIGIKPCGCTVAAIVDKPEYRKDVAKETGSWLRSGMTVERVPIEDGRARLKSCRCGKPAEGQGKLEGLNV